MGTQCIESVRGSWIGLLNLQPAWTHVGTQHMNQHVNLEEADREDRGVQNERLGVSALRMDPGQAGMILLQGREGLSPFPGALNIAESLKKKRLHLTLKATFSAKRNGFIVF